MLTEVSYETHAVSSLPLCSSRLELQGCSQSKLPRLLRMRQALPPVVGANGRADSSGAVWLRRDPVWWELADCVRRQHRAVRPSPTPSLGGRGVCGGWGAARHAVAADGSSAVACLAATPCSSGATRLSGAACAGRPAGRRPLPSLAAGRYDRGPLRSLANRSSPRVSRRRGRRCSPRSSARRSRWPRCSRRT